MHYCLHVRVILGEGGGVQPPPFHAWTGFLIADMFQDGLEEWITEAVVLAPGEAILFSWWWSLKEGLPPGNARNVGFRLASSVTWARREHQVETMVSTVQEGHWAIVGAIVDKRTKAMGARPPWGTTKTNQTPTAAYNIKECMQGLKEDASKVEERNGDVGNGGTEWRNVHSQHVSKGKRWHRRQGATQLLGDTFGGSPSYGGVCSDQGSNWSSHQLTMPRGSRDGNWAGGRRRSEDEGQPANLQGWKDQRCCDLLFMAVACSYFPQLRLGWPTLAVGCCMSSSHYRGCWETLPGV